MRYTRLIFPTEVIHTRCLSMLADLWHAPTKLNAIGTATTGSSEVVQLGGLAMKRAWQERMKAMGENVYQPGSNIVMGELPFIDICRILTRSRC